MNEREEKIQRVIRYVKLVKNNGWEGEDMLWACEVLLDALIEARTFADKMTNKANAVIDAQERQHYRNIALGMPRSKHFLDIEKALDTDD